MSSIEERVKKIVIEQLGVNEDQVVTSASFVDDLGADSLGASGKRSRVSRASVSFVICLACCPGAQT